MADLLMTHRLYRPYILQILKMATGQNQSLIQLFYKTDILILILTYFVNCFKFFKLYEI